MPDGSPVGGHFRGFADFEMREALPCLPFSEQVRLAQDRVTRDYWREHALFSAPFLRKLHHPQ